MVIHTGFWGCGAFGGNRVIRAAVQILAAGMAGIETLVFYSGRYRKPLDEACALPGSIAAGAPVRMGLQQVIAGLSAAGLRWGRSNRT